MTERFALYYAPAATSPLWARAAGWLGRDPAGNPIAPAPVPGLETEYRMQATESARRYGFHATIKAPMALADGTRRDELEAALADYGGRAAPVRIGRLELRFIDGFLALVPVRQSAALTAAAGEIVRAFDRFRAPLTAAERARRTADGRLSPRQVELLDTWGYPYVMEEFRFHMTLTDRLPEGERSAVLSAAEDWFAATLEAHYVLDRIALFHERVRRAPFERLSDFLLRAEAAVNA